MPRLENWIIMSRVDLHGKLYQRLIGDVYGHPGANTETGELCDGNNIMTSKLLNLDLANCVAITQTGTVYNLGFKSAIEKF